VAAEVTEFTQGADLCTAGRPRWSVWIVIRQHSGPIPARGWL